MLFSSLVLYVLHLLPSELRIMTSLQVGVTTYLGFWQAQRYQWKVNLLSERKSALSKPSQELSAAIKSMPYVTSCDTPGLLTHTPPLCDCSKDRKRIRDEVCVPVTVTGVLDLDNEMLVGPRAPPPGAPSGTPQMGFYIVTPLILDNSSAAYYEEASSADDGAASAAAPAAHFVLVNRGWVPAAKRGSLAPGHEDEGGVLRAGAGKGPLRVTVKGVLRGSEAGGQFAPAHTGAGSFGWFDFPSMAVYLAEAGGAPVRSPAGSFFDLPFAVDAQQIHPADTAASSSGEGGVPAFPLRRSEEEYHEVQTHPATHLSYSFTWFALALFGVAMTRRRFKPSGNRRSGAAVYQAMQAQQAAAKASGAGAGPGKAAGVAGLMLASACPPQAGGDEDAHAQ